MLENVGLNPWVRIWVEPRRTIAAIVKYNPGYLFPLLAAIYGLPMLFHFAQNLSLGQNYSLTAIIIVCLILCALAGTIGITIVTALLTWTGKWIGGKGSFKNIRAAVAWSNVPIVINIAMWFVLIGFFGNQVFLANFPEMAFMGKELGIVSLVYLIESIMSIWSFIIMLHTLGEVQGFSAWRALLNVIIPFVLVMIAVWIIVVIFMQFGTSGAPQITS